MRCEWVRGQNKETEKLTAAVRQKRQLNEKSVRSVGIRPDLSENGGVNRR